MDAIEAQQSVFDFRLVAIFRILCENRWHMDALGALQKVFDFQIDAIGRVLHSKSFLIF